jgi:hypothetical protein
MGTAAGLNIVDVLRLFNVTDIKDSDASQALVTYGFRNSFGAAVQSSAKSFAGYKQQVSVDGDVTLRCRAEKVDNHFGCGGILNIPDDESVVVPLDGVVIFKSEVGSPGGDKIFGRRSGREKIEIPDRLFGIKQSGSEALRADRDSERLLP